MHQKNVPEMLLVAAACMFLGFAMIVGTLTASIFSEDDGDGAFISFMFGVVLVGASFLHFYTLIKYLLLAAVSRLKKTKL